jgi:hypothetical protein
MPQFCVVPGEPARAAYWRVRYAMPHFTHAASQPTAETAGGWIATEAPVSEADDASAAGIHVKGAPHS